MCCLCCSRRHLRHQRCRFIDSVCVTVRIQRTSHMDGNWLLFNSQHFFPLFVFHFVKLVWRPKTIAVLCGRWFLCACVQWGALFGRCAYVLASDWWKLFDLMSSDFAFGSSVGWCVIDIRCANKLRIPTVYASLLSEAHLWTSFYAQTRKNALADANLLFKFFNHSHEDIFFFIQHFGKNNCILCSFLPKKARKKIVFAKPVSRSNIKRVDN